MADLSELRTQIRAQHLMADDRVLQALSADVPSDVQKDATFQRASDLITAIRNDSTPGLMEVFLAEYGLSTDEGVALMCLAEALLRVPDAETIDALIEDKIAPSQWGAHLGKSSSSLVNASTWALMLTGKVLDEEGTGVAGVLHSAIKRLGEPVIRTATKRAMKEMGAQFVLGETIQEALSRGQKMVDQGYTYSYDMLGEAAITADDAQDFYDSYLSAITSLGAKANSSDIRENPGISVKLSALHPRYELGQKDRAMDELAPRLLSLCQAAQAARIGLNIDAEEADRLDLSLDVIQTVCADASLAGWDGFGVVVQGYGKRAGPVIEWLYALAQHHNRKMMIRLVKGAYWDTEIKRAQVEGIAGFPVFSRKTSTDMSYICCANKLLGMTDRIYPQFATHNAHTIAAVLELAKGTDGFEFQRLHGMGEAAHALAKAKAGTRCRIYAPVGAHRDLLAYLVRRLLENGANSSFVNQIVDHDLPTSAIATDPFMSLDDASDHPDHIPYSAELFCQRRNSIGWDLHNTADVAAINAARLPFQDHKWSAGPIMVTDTIDATAQSVFNPAYHSDCVGQVSLASPDDVQMALAAAAPWTATAPERAVILNQAADLYEAHFGELFAAITREAGKPQADAIGELREAVDFLRYYAGQATNGALDTPLGLVTCISPWNFPLAIFTGQLSAALAAGNGVLAKPAETTPIISSIAVQLLHQAGVPKHALQLLPGAGSVVGAALTSDPRIGGICFTGSTATAQTIHRSMANALPPSAPLIAETGGLNAMIVDSTALPEQAVTDIVMSAFLSAGQRCSALRVLYLQEDVAAPFLKMLYGAMDELTLGNPWDFATDLGPVIDANAQTQIATHIRKAEAEGRLLKQLSSPTDGTFVGPAVLRVGGIKDLKVEVFGPVLHVATFKADELDTIVADVNASGFGLTFGLHTRIDDRVQHVTSRLKVGNIYVNRNQIGAIVGSQPFGGEGLSGTGPKAGGPRYLPRFTKPDQAEGNVVGNSVNLADVQHAILTAPESVDAPLEISDLPGPTGESNRLSIFPRGKILCLGPSAKQAEEQAKIAQEMGNTAIIIAPVGALNGCLIRDDLAILDGFDAVILWSNPKDQSLARQALARRKGAIIPLITAANPRPWLVIERHLCIDTTASGGNASLLAAI